MRRPRVIRAKNYQAKDNPYRLIADVGVRPLGTALAETFKHLRATLPQKAVAAQIRAGRYHAAAHEISVQRFRDGLNMPFTVIRNIYQASAERAVRQLKHDAPLKRLKRVRKAGEFSFDMMTPEVVDQLARYQEGLLSGLTDDVREIVVQTIIDGVANELSPEEIADEIAKVIGLTPAQAQAVANYRVMLEGGDPAVLQRSLMDPADAEAFQSAADDGLVLPDNEINDMVQRYSDATLQMRAETIARTEASRAANIGMSAAYGQAIEQGLLPDTVMRYWEIALDERTCQVCRDIPDMNPDGRAHDDPFDTTLGPIDYPPVHPNCRCTVAYDTSLDQADAEF